MVYHSKIPALKLKMLTCFLRLAEGYLVLSNTSRRHQLNLLYPTKKKVSTQLPPQPITQAQQAAETVSSLTMRSLVGTHEMFSPQSPPISKVSTRGPTARQSTTRQPESSSTSPLSRVPKMPWIESMPSKRIRGPRRRSS